MMDQVLGIRPFVPAKDYQASHRYYEALGFRTTHTDEHLTLLKAGSFSFILQNFYHKDMAENLMVQMLVRDVNAWWRDTDPAAAGAPFGVRPPKPPAMQEWGMLVGFLFDPSGVLWHVAEVPF